MRRNWLPRWRDGLRRRWMTAFAVMLAILMAAGAATWVFSRSVVGRFGTAAHRYEAAGALTADLRRDVSSHEHTGHLLLNDIPTVEVDGFLGEQAWIAQRFRDGHAVLHSGAQAAQLDRAFAMWRQSLVDVRLWGTDASTSRPARRVDDDALHGALTARTAAVLDALAQLDSMVRATVDTDLRDARDLEHAVFAVVGLLFLLAAAFAVGFARRMAHDLLDPISRLRESAQRLEHGDLATRVDVSDRVRTTELGELAEAFNTMTDAVRRVQEERVTLLRRTLDVAEQERTRLANELHDGPIQRLAAMSYLMDAGVVRSEANPAIARDCLLEIRGQASYEIQGLRRLMADLRPPALDQGGLVAALHYYVEVFADTNDIRVSVTGDVGVTRLEPAVETVAYRLVQEAMTNIRRHANATRADVRLSRTGGSVTVTVADDGIGFDRSRPRVDQHLGLATLAERVTSVGGSFEVRTSPGEGTVVEARIPTAIAVPEPRQETRIVSHALSES